MYLCQMLSYHDHTTGNHDELELDHGQAPEMVSSRDCQLHIRAAILQALPLEL
jgi:hypothetical protein